MSSPSAELTASSVGVHRSFPRAAVLARSPDARFYLLLALGVLLIASVSLVIPSTPSYDPWSWLIWGREVIHLNLQTTGGPTWKPLPVILTTVLALFGHAQPFLWLVVARAGALAAAVMVFRVAARLTWWISGVDTGAEAGAEGAAAGHARTDRLAVLAPGVLAGLIAAVGLVFTGGFISDNALGYSEGLMTALVLIALERHLDGHPRQAFTIGFFAALDRPEIWLFWGPYGLYLFWRDPGARRLVIALFVLIPVLWFGPEYWGSGHFFRGVDRAHHPRSNSPAFAKCPLCSLLVKHAWPTILLRIKGLAVLAVGAAAWLLVRTRRSGQAISLADRGSRGLILVAGAGILGLVWFFLIAALTQAGFSGNDRYLVLGAALVDIAGGVGWGWLAVELGRSLPHRLRRLGERRGRASGVALALAGFVLLPNFVGSNLISLQRTHRSLVYQAHLRIGLEKLVRRYGGAHRLLSCGTIMTEGFQVPLVAWTLGTHSDQIEAPPLTKVAPPPWPNVILQTRDTRHAALLPGPKMILAWEADGARYHLFARTRAIRLFTDCRK